MDMPFIRIVHLLRNLGSCRGQGVVEYALLLLLIAIVAILMMRGIGDQTCVFYSQVNSSLQ